MMQLLLTGIALVLVCAVLGLLKRLHRRDRARAVLIAISMVVGTAIALPLSLVGLKLYERRSERLRFDRVTSILALPLAVHDYADNHGGHVPDDLREAVANSILRPRIERDASTHRTLDSALVLRDVDANLPRIKETQRFVWLVVLFVPGESMPGPWGLNGEDCLYWFGERSPDAKPAYFVGQEFTPLDKAITIFGPDVVGRAKRRHDEARQRPMAQ